MLLSAGAANKLGNWSCYSLGVVQKVSILLGLRDGCVGVACRGVVGSQLPVGRTYHLETIQQLDVSDHCAAIYYIIC